MGFGDELMASGQAQDVGKRGKRAAFSNHEKRKIIWAPPAHEIHRHNPYVAQPGEEHALDLEWITNCSGHRPYAKQQNGRWLFRDFTPTPGHIFFTSEEALFAAKHEMAFGARHELKRYIIVEPRVKPMGACAGANKQWAVENYKALVECLRDFGLECAQLVAPKQKALLSHVARIETPTFRHAAAVLGRATMYVGPEGGLHHAAAAAGIQAVVIFGGFANPKSTGYAFHRNISVGEPCGQIAACAHCAEIMKSITVDQVYKAVIEQL